MLREATISERKIVNAFIELLEESPLEHISITDIIKKANLSRPTFYSRLYHLKIDKEQLIPCATRDFTVLFIYFGVVYGTLAYCFSSSNLTNPLFHSISKSLLSSCISGLS